MKFNVRWSLIFSSLSLLFTQPALSIEPEGLDDVLIRHIESVSRDFYYIQLNKDQSPLVVPGFVGGEHQFHYRLLGFEGERFRITLKTLDGETYYGIEGEGVELSELDDKTEVKINSEVTWIDISTSAGTFTSKYTLTIEKLN